MEKFAVEFSWVLTDAIRTSTFIMENNAATWLCRFCFRLKKFDFSYILKLILSIAFGGGTRLDLRMKEIRLENVYQ